MVRIAVASDLHAVAAGDAASFLVEGGNRAAWKTHPLESLRRLVEHEAIKVDYLLCPGDFANQCSLAGLQTGWAAIAEIAGVLNAVPVSTIGNHDLDSHHIHGVDVFAPARNLSPDFPIGNRLANEGFWRDGFVLLGDARVSVLVLNSVRNHDDPAQIEHGLIRDDVLDRLDDFLTAAAMSELRVAMVHHHPHLHEDLGLGAGDVMYGGQKLILLLARHGFQLIVHGHKHHPKLIYAAGEPGAPTIFAAGSLTHINYAQLASNTRNLFHVVTMQPSVSADRTVEGTVRSWQFNCGIGWNPATASSAGFPFYAGFGCTQTAVQLAEAITPLVGERRPWPEILHAVSCLPFTLPKTRDAIFSYLRERQQMRVLWDENGEPVEIAGTSGPNP